MKHAILIVAALTLAIVPMSGHGAGGALPPGQVYYDGVIDVLVSGKQGDLVVYEKTTIKGFQIAHWLDIPGDRWMGDSFTATVNMELNDHAGGTAVVKFGPGEFRWNTKDGGPVPDVASLHIERTPKGYKYSLAVSPPHPPGESSGVPLRFPMHWVLPEQATTTGGDYLPLEISGKFEKSEDGLTTRFTWVLSRHVKP